MEAKVRTAVLAQYFEVAAELGLNMEPLLRQAGLTRVMLENAEQRIAMSSALQLLEASAQASHCETFGLRMAQHRQFSSLGAISLLLTHQPTLREVLITVMRYRHLFNNADTLAIQIEQTGGTVILKEELVAQEQMLSRQAIELALGVLCRLCAAILGAHWNPQRVLLTHAAPQDPQTYRRVFRCPVEFDADLNGIVCASVDLDFPNPRADPLMVEYARRFVDTLPDEKYASMALVVRYIDNPNYSLRRISQLLGYSTAGAFTRWFVAAFGMPPTRWRAHAKCLTTRAPSQRAHWPFCG